MELSRISHDEQANILAEHQLIYWEFVKMDFFTENTRSYECYAFETSYVYSQRKQIGIKIEENDWVCKRSERKWAMGALNRQNNGQDLRDWERCTTSQQNFIWIGSKSDHKEYKTVNME